MDYRLDDHPWVCSSGYRQFFRRAFCARCGHDTEQANHAHRGGWVCRECCRKVLTQEEFDRQQATKVTYSVADIYGR